MYSTGNHIYYFVKIYKGKESNKHTHTHTHTHTHSSSDGKESACNVGDIWIRFLDWDDPLEKGMATHSSILAWRIPWTEESDRLQSKGSQSVRHN